MTNHAAEITSLQERVAWLSKFEDAGSTALEVRALKAVQALLEVHDATGISLDDWAPVRELVEHVINAPVQKNGV